MIALATLRVEAVDFIEEQDCGTVSVRMLEDVAQPPLALPEVLVDDGRAADVVELCPGGPFFGASSTSSRSAVINDSTSSIASMSLVIARARSIGSATFPCSVAAERAADTSAG